MNNYIDQKVTIWMRCHFSDETDMNDIVKLLEKNSLNNLCDMEFGFEESEILYDTEGELTVEENYDEATIEVYQNNIEIYNNEKSNQ